MKRILIGSKVEPNAAKILLRAARKKKQTPSAYCAAVLEQHALSLSAKGK